VSSIARRESTTRLGSGGTSFQRQSQHTVRCNNHELNAPIGYKVCHACPAGSLTFGPPDLGNVLYCMVVLPP
jgi:hypothetical protein